MAKLEEITLHLSPPILASASPRRRQWLEALQIPFEVLAPELDETPLAGEEPKAMVARLARAKAALVAGANPPVPVQLTTPWFAQGTAVTGVPLAPLRTVCWAAPVRVPSTTTVAVELMVRLPMLGVSPAATVAV